MVKKYFIYLIFGLFFLAIVSNLASAQNKLDIQINNTYSPGENINFKVFVYDESNKKLEGKVNYQIFNYYTDLIGSGNVLSDEDVNFLLPADAIQGLWKITASYNGIEIERFFNVGSLEKLEIGLELDNLILTNMGNVPYEKPITISIGDKTQIALVSLAVGQTKTIHLTAPAGEYNIKVTDGSKENEKTFEGVGLTGNVVGLEKLSEGNFLKQYPVVSLFLGSILLVVIVILLLKFQKKFFD